VFLKAAVLHRKLQTIVHAGAALNLKSCKKLTSHFSMAKDEERKKITKEDTINLYLL